MFLFKWIRSFQHPQDHLSVFPTLFVSSVLKLPLFSRPPNPFFFKDWDSLFNYPFCWWEPNPFFQSMFLSSYSNEVALQVHHCSFSFFSSGFKSSFVDHILSSFQCSLMPVQFLIIHLSPFNCSRVLKISQKIRVFHSAFIQDLSRLLSNSCHLIQSVQSLF